MKANHTVTPSEFYRGLRPEYFSDSQVNYSHKLTNELLAFELDRITTNQKEAEFETLCRKLSEKLITPNLIPQVGPTGGGDGKTDSETFEVSELISNRWFIPENGWARDEKWAFAFSAKKVWKPKVKDDVKKIVETNRGYTKVFFITNQSVSSKEKRATEDLLRKKHSIEVSILDAVWITESVITNALYELVVDSLNLSSEYSQKETVVGPNDARRQAKLDKLEQDISNAKRYYEYDFQLFEDAIEAAILSRMLEKSRSEVEGRFDRAERICKKLNIRQQWLKLHYQRAWTCFNWYDDYAGFIEGYKRFKECLRVPQNQVELAHFTNLYNLLFQVYEIKDDSIKLAGLSFKKERQFINQVLGELARDEIYPTLSVIAQTYQSQFNIFAAIELDDELKIDQQLVNLSKNLTEGSKFIEYPFETFRKIVDVIGKALPDNPAHDNLVDVIASISEKRQSSTSSGQIFLTRAFQKMNAENYVGATVYFGKALMGFAKEETQDELFGCLMGLGISYRNLGLCWASSSCFAGCARIAFKPWHMEGKLEKRVYQSIKELAINELFIGRLPFFLSFYELLETVRKQIDVQDEINGIPANQFFDGALSVRLLNSDQTKQDFSLLPDVLDSLELWSANVASLYMLGHTEELEKDFDRIKDQIASNDIHEFHKLGANQPLRDQLLYETELISSKQVSFTTKILGCRFNLNCNSTPAMVFAAETYLAFLEGFFATSLQQMHPTFEKIQIELVFKRAEEIFSFTQPSTNQFVISINKFDFPHSSTDAVWLKMLEFSGHVVESCFAFENPQKQMDRIFKDEELFNRLGFAFEHAKSMNNILGDTPKISISDWEKHTKAQHYENTRPSRLIFNNSNRFDTDDKAENFDFDSVGHDKREVFSVIDNRLWDKAAWQGFGFFIDNSGPALFLGFENGDIGKQIFVGWSGIETLSNRLSIAIIKGVDERNPDSYRVNIGSKIDKTGLREKSVFSTISRFHELTPQTGKNLSNIELFLSKLEEIRIFPATMNDFKPTICQSIHITAKVSVVNAWELSLNNLESLVIFGDDKPVIPPGIENPPILEVLAAAKERNKT